MDNVFCVGVTSAAFEQLERNANNGCSGRREVWSRQADPSIPTTTTTTTTTTTKDQAKLDPAHQDNSLIIQKGRGQPLQQLTPRFGG